MAKGWRVLLVSRNNPEMISAWAEYNPSLCDYALNIDESTDEKLAEEVRRKCEDANIKYEIATEHGMCGNIRQFIDYYLDESITYAFYMHHDSYLFSDKDVERIDEIAELAKDQNFGIIGFNIINGESEISSFLDGRKHFGITARSVLGYTQGYYRPEFFNRTNYTRFPKDKVFAVESVMWTTALLNITKFQENIIPDQRFSFFHSWDDIAHQFLAKNVYNVCVPFISIAHDQAIKERLGFSRSSPIGSKEKVKHFYGSDASQHLVDWESKWGYPWSLDPGYEWIRKQCTGRTLMAKCFRLLVKFIFRFAPEILPTETHLRYAVNRSKYEETYLDLFFKHDPQRGPVKVFTLT